MNWQCCHSNTEHVREPCAPCVCRLLPPSISPHPSVSFHPLQRSLALSRPNRPGNGSPLRLPCQLPAAPVVSGGERDNDITLAGLTVLILHFSCLCMPLFLSRAPHLLLVLFSLVLLSALFTVLSATRTLHHLGFYYHIALSLSPFYVHKCAYGVVLTHFIFHYYYCYGFCFYEMIFIEMEIFWKFFTFGNLCKNKHFLLTGETKIYSKIKKILNIF